MKDPTREHLRHEEIESHPVPRRKWGPYLAEVGTAPERTAVIAAVHPGRRFLTPDTIVTPSRVRDEVGHRRVEAPEVHP